MNKSTLKSIGAVFAGIIVIFILSGLTDFILESLGIFTPFGEGFFTTWMVVTAFIYRCIYAVVGAYVTARLAPNRPMRHVIILGLVGVVLSIIGTFVAWDMSPHWYPILLVISSLPCSWLGGKLYLNRQSMKAA